MKKIIKALFIILYACIWTSTSNAQPPGTEANLTMSLEGVSIVTVLTQIAKQNNLNIVISNDVKGTVTMRLENVDLRTALDAILIPNNYNYYIQNNVIVVKPLDNSTLGERLSRVVTLNYAQPEIVKKALEPYRSDKGNIVILDYSNDNSRAEYSPTQLMITDLADIVYEMEKIINTLDVAERLVSIEVRIIETKVDTKDKLGIAWPTQVRAKIGSDNSITGSDDGTDAGSSLTNSAAGTYDLETGVWNWGKLTIDELQATLDLLDQDNNSELISNPHIIVTENHEAEIKAETIIPIPTVNRFTEGASSSDILTFYDEEIGISLKVTPRINNDGQITLDVFPKVEDIIGFAGPPDNRKPITASRSIRTRITVANGETIVLGGLLKEDEIIIENKVPLLGQIPLLGKLLFTNRSVEKTTTDLVIMLTPRIIK